MKQCFKCKEEKPISEFYAHPMMADGHLGKCKSCSRADVKKNRKRKISYYRKYDRERGNRQTADDVREYRTKYRFKYAAHLKVSNALKRGLIKRLSCEMCGDRKTHAHHDDYSKPLSVVWLCAACHKERHKELDVWFETAISVWT